MTLKPDPPYSARLTSFAGRAFAWGVLVRLVLVGQDLGQRAESAFEPSAGSVCQLKGWHSDGPLVVAADGA
jgi:hypothetical protein